MNSKWYFSAVILILALLGIKMEHNSLSNQEIVVQFTTEEIAQDQAQNTLAAVKNQLQGIGVENIQIKELVNGGIKITYYSDLTVSEIQQILGEAQLYMGHPMPNQKDEPIKVSTSLDSKSFELNIYEILNQPNNDIDVEGSLVDITQVKERFVHPNGFGFVHPGSCTEKHDVEILSRLVCGKQAFQRRDISYRIPEVRAGPLS